MTGDRGQDDQESTVGWDAIDAALSPLYGGQEPKHFAAPVPWILGGPDPLQGISVWKRLAPVPHWHFITYGLSELYAKESEDAAVSGYGIELTFRLRCAATDTETPAWPLNLLQNLARYIFKTGNVFASGHWMNANGPIALETDTELVSIAFVSDPELPAIETPNGHLAFLQLVGLTIDEEQAIKRWNAEKLMAAFAPHMPLWITDLGRTSLLAEPEVSASVDEGSARDGSSTGFLFTEALGWGSRKRIFRSALVTVQLGAAQVEELITLLSLRLPFGQDMRMAGPQAMLLFAPAEQDSVIDQATELHIALSPATLAAFASILRPVAGTYEVPGLDIRWEVQQSLIRDGHGAVIRTVG